MDESLEKILDTLPPKPSRSRLEPYREFIRELRRRGRSYQEIAHILRDRCGVTAGVHSVYNFVRVRERAEKGARPGQHSGARSAETATSTGVVLRAHLQPRSLAGSDAWKNIDVVKRRQTDGPVEEKVFAFDENEPLRLVRGTDRTSAGKNTTKPER